MMDIQSKDSSDEDRRSRRKKTVEDKRRKKRRYSSTDSYSSDESSSDSYSSDSDSESDSSDTSSSSDHRHKRRKRTSRKDKYRHGKKKEPKKQRGQKKKSTSKSKLGPEPPSSSESESTSSSNSESKKSDRRGKRRKDNLPMQAVGPSTRTASVLKEKEPEISKKNEQLTDKDGPSDEEGEVIRAKDVTKDDHYLEAKSAQLTRKSNRSPIENTKENQNGSPVSRKPTSPEDNQTNHSKSPVRGGPGYDVSEPTLKQGQDDPRNDSLNGASKRIRKGRGFTEKYHYVRKYRSPSPERTSIQSNYYRGRNEYRRDWNRYPNPRQRNYNEHGSRQRNYNEHSPPRVYRSSPRGSSPHRYRSRRARSRSTSRSPVRYHGQRDNSRSPRTHRSTLHGQRPAGDRPQSSHDLQERVQHPGKGRSRSRSRSGGSASKSPDRAGKANNENKRTRKSRSSSRSSSPGNNGLVSYGDGSPDS